MPAKKTGTKLHINFARAKKKIKDAGVGLAVASASIAPMKSAAQNRVIDPESKEISALVHAIRIGMTVENKSSPEKIIQIFKENLGPENEYLSNFDVVLNDIWYIDGAKTLTPPVGSKSSVSEEMEDRVFNSMESDGLGPYYNLLNNAMVSQKGDKYTYNTDGLYDKYFTIAKRLFPRTNELKTKDVIIRVYCAGVLDQVAMFENVTSSEHLTYFGTMILDAATGDVLHYNNDPMPHIDTYRQLPIVAYKLNGEDGRITHVWDASDGVDYIYKTDQEDGIINTFNPSNKSHASPAAVLMHKHVQDNEH